MLLLERGVYVYVRVCVLSEAVDRSIYIHMYHERDAPSDLDVPPEDGLEGPGCCQAQRAARAVVGLEVRGVALHVLEAFLAHGDGQHHAERDEGRVRG